MSSHLAYDSAAEQKLLDLANQARVQAGLAPLHTDDGLTEAAREHAAAIAERQQLSHQLPGEAPLAQRLATSTNLHLERGGENVATAATVDQIYASLMRSPPHRENLLNPSFNVAGFGVVRNGYLLFVTQDFGEGRATYSAQTSEDMVAASATQMRQQQRRSSLLRLNSGAAQAAACSMARANSLNTPMSRDMAQSRYLLRYTSNQPQNLPSSAPRAIGDRNISAFAVGSCYAKTASYPNGVYWVALMFY
ncbi:MAG TPA: CAP domain-containing protein [Terriglobales bacterium]|nr:CAP domain-containing protein [Terriglobales bacterium]